MKLMKLGKISALKAKPEIERRKFERKAVYHLVKFKVKPAIFFKKALFSSRDISAGGLRLLFHNDIPRGTEVELFINFSDSTNTLLVTARVVWTKKLKNSKLFEIGLEFTGIDEEFRREIGRRIAYAREARDAG